jgi:hypothetical protein
MQMAPRWLANETRLADDEKLRELQLKWFADDIWMRRVAFCLFVLLTVAGTLMVLLDPLPHTSGIGSLGLASAPLSWLIAGVWRRRRW